MALLAGDATATPPTGMAGDIYAAIVALSAAWAPPGTALQQFCNAVASGVVSHITAHAVVTPTLLVAPSGGGPVTGTGSVT